MTTTVQDYNPASATGHDVMVDGRWMAASAPLKRVLDVRAPGQVITVRIRAGMAVLAQRL
jgi:hypothetical protein